MSDRATVLLLAIPALVLAGGALLRSVPGEWSQSALLAWAAVGLGFLSGQASGSAPMLGAAGLLLGFLALALGGAVGLGVLAALYLALTAASLIGLVASPWFVAALLAAACAAGAIRALIYSVA